MSSWDPDGRAGGAVNVAADGLAGGGVAGGCGVADGPAGGAHQAYLTRRNPAAIRSLAARAARRPGVPDYGRLVGSTATTARTHARTHANRAFIAPPADRPRAHDAY